VSLESLRRRFDDDSAYDRLMLETVVGADLLLRELPSSSIDDLRGPSLSLERHVSDSLGAPARAELLDRLRPPLFATAWKVLDLIVELIRELATGKSPRRGWPIEDKVKFVRGRPPGLPEPFISYPAFWTRLSKLYARLKEARHAIIHRRLKRSASGGITPYGDKRRPLRTISVMEVDALVLASYGLAEELIAAALTVDGATRSPGDSMSCGGSRSWRQSAPRPPPSSASSESNSSQRAAAVALISKRSVTISPRRAVSLASPTSRRISPKRPPSIAAASRTPRIEKASSSPRRGRLLG
jgi:hypothetical protein